MVTIMAMVVEVLEMILTNIVEANMEVNNHRSLKLARQLIKLIVEVFHSIVRLLIGPLLLVLRVERRMPDLVGRDQQVTIDVGKLDTSCSLNGSHQGGKGSGGRGQGQTSGRQAYVFTLTH